MQPARKFLLQNKNGATIVPSLKIANTFLTRLKGLMGTKSLLEGEGLLISPCQQVHTHFMYYSLDIVFLNKELEVVKILENLKPWRFSQYVKEAHFVLELQAYTAKNKTAVGERLSLVQT